MLSVATGPVPMGMNTRLPVDGSDAGFARLRGGVLFLPMLRTWWLFFHEGANVSKRDVGNCQVSR